MSISKETLQKHLKDPAIFCCQRQKGLLISEADLEDPVIFPDLEDSGLLTLSKEGLTIEAVIGKTLKKNVEALTPITGEMLVEGNSIAKVSDEANEVSEEVNTSKITFNGGDGMIHLSIEELKGLTLDIPLNSLTLPLAGITGTTLVGSKELQTTMDIVNKDNKSSSNTVIPANAVIPADKILPTDRVLPAHKVLRTLVKKEYKVKEVILGDTTSFDSGILTIDKGLVQKAKDCNPLVKAVELDIITVENRHIFTNTIMDIIPVAAKISGKLGEGETAVLDGVVFCLTGLDEKGVQIHEFGSCEGFIDEKVAFGRPGCPDETDIMIRVNVVIQEGTGMERRGPFAAHCACDLIIQEIREVLKKTTAPVISEEVLKDVHKYDRPRVVLVKEIMGQGAMHDNILRMKY
ncbi:MAG: prdA [Anaerocolumna sp.]|nr:prdA [Anaerocolumna sp.]